MSDVKHRTGSHPWAGAEASFQILLALARGKPVVPMMYERAVIQVHGQCRMSALLLLRKLGACNAELECMDVANSLFIELHTSILPRCDCRPVYPYAFQAMRHLCLAVLRANTRHRELPRDFDAASAGDSPLQTLIEQEERDILQEMVDALPLKQREAARRLTRPGRRRGERSAEPLTQADYSSAYRARLRLRKRLGRNGDLGL